MQLRMSPGRQHVELFAQASAGAAVVADGDYGAQFADLDGARVSPHPDGCDVTLQAFEKSGKPGASADGDHVQAASRRGFASGPTSRIRWGSATGTASRLPQGWRGPARIRPPDRDKAVR